MSRASAPVRLLSALLIAALTGLLLAAAAFPLVGALGLTAKARADEFLVLPAELETQALNQRSRIVAADGSTIAFLYKQDRVEVDLAQVLPETRKAVIAIEDSRFYAHDGVDYKGTLRAAIENAKSGRVSQGGSTLTQQYVKNALLLAAGDEEGQEAAVEQSFERKLKEARYALSIEQELQADLGSKTAAKDEILERYLNIAYYGNGAYGIGSAASFYFGGKTVEKLTLAESATLAGLVQRPGQFDPVKALEDPKAMQAVVTRRNTVLARMRQLGMITEQERVAAASTVDAPGKPLFRIRAIASGCEAPGVKAPFFCDYVRNYLENGPIGKALGLTREARQAKLLGGGLVIKTTLSPGIQAISQRTVEESVPPADPEQIAAVVDVVEPGTGFVKAMAVNRRYTESKAPGHTKVNLATGGSSGFQGGSTFKAFVLADAIRQGIPLSYTLFAPQEYFSPVFDETPGGPPYSPQNAGDSESGTFDLTTATHDSVNTYFVQLEERLAVDGKVEGPAALAESLGVRKGNGAPLNRGGSFVLGGDEVSPLDMAAAYATFAARGLFCPAKPVVSITDAAGQDVPLAAPACKQVLEQPVADTVNQVLTGVIDGSTPGRTGRAASIGRPAAGKTGTTNGSRAAWFVGYTPQLSTAVWLGDPGGRPGELIKEMRSIRINGRFYRQVFGGTLPAPIWRRTMAEALEGQPVRSFERPDRLSVEGLDVQIPNVSGLDLDDAEDALRDAGFSVRDGGRRSGSGVPAGQAAFTSPRAGTEVEFGSRVTLYESNGRAFSTTPSTRAPEPVAPEPVVEPAAAETVDARPAAAPANGNGQGRKRK